LIIKVIELSRAVLYSGDIGTGYLLYGRGRQILKKISKLIINYLCSKVVEEKDMGKGR
jgi:hypothetical protein